MRLLPGELSDEAPQRKGPGRPKKAPGTAKVPIKLSLQPQTIQFLQDWGEGISISDAVDRLAYLARVQRIAGLL